jgi:CRISPR-associated protein (TIGR03984 family)
VTETALTPETLHADLRPLDSGECEKLIRGCLGEGHPGQPAEWGLIHQDGGHVWGTLLDGSWQWASHTHPRLCPKPDAERLTSLRIFSRERELLVWRDGGRWRGRALGEAEHGGRDPVLSRSEAWLLLGDRVHDPEFRHEGFTALADQRGRRQVLPLTWPGGHATPRAVLEVCHHFAENSETGGVRIAATRFVNLRAKG